MSIKNFSSRQQIWPIHGASKTMSLGTVLMPESGILEAVRILIYVEVASNLIYGKSYMVKIAKDAQGNLILSSSGYVSLSKILDDYNGQGFFGYVKFQMPNVWIEAENSYYVFIESDDQVNNDPLLYIVKGKYPENHTRIEFFIRQKDDL